jgi:methionine--tRNA ligase beta chain
MATYDDFLTIELKVAKVVSVEKVEKSNKLLKLIVDIGTEQRQILAGIGLAYKPEQMIGKEIVIVANLEPRMLMGLESNGMLLAAGDGEPVLVCPEKEVTPGSSVH